MKRFLIGVALIALAGGPLVAQGKGHGQGNEGHGNPAHGPSMQGPTMQGPTMASAPHGNSRHQPPAMAPSMKASTPRHGGKALPLGQAKRAEAKPGRTERSGGPKPNPAEVTRATDHGRGNGKAAAEAVRILQDGRRYYSQRDARPKIDFAAARPRAIAGCPPGLAKKYNGCQPPGLARQAMYQPAWWGLPSLGAGRYGYADGYLLRLDGDSIASYFPLLGGALAVGNPWPTSYAPLEVPPYYVDYYDLGPPGGYRYADDVLYRVDPATSAISSIAGLLTGDQIQIGSPMPPGYDVYNVPYRYRSQYSDGSNAWYRYSDGYIYQVDPTTQLVAAAIDLLGG